MTSAERLGYLAHAATPAFQRRVDEARTLIAAHPGCAVSVSWGKDSVVLLHLAAHTLPRVAAINARYRPEERLPDTDAVRDAVLARLPNVAYREAPCVGEWEMYERAGFFVDPETPEQREAVRWWKEAFLEALAEARRALGATGVMLGLRADESRARGMNYAVRGSSYLRQGERVVTPLARWRGPDVWAYHVLHDLPWLHAYDAAPDRERARSAFTFATGGAGAIRRHGAWLEWRAAYPTHFEGWLERFPAMRALI